jgi:hypothetical protein
LNKSLKNMPQFTAEAALYSTTMPYYAYGKYQESEQIVYLADYIDQACVGACLQNCGAVCVGGKADCISECRNENEACRASCTRPGDPPPSTPTNPPDPVSHDFSNEQLVCPFRDGGVTRIAYGGCTNTVGIPSCITRLGGLRQCAGALFQYPYIVYCDLGSRSYAFRSGVGFCFG